MNIQALIISNILEVLRFNYAKNILVP
jgi:hypothetical protein